jgi:hypothetical protein
LPEGRIGGLPHFKNILLAITLNLSFIISGNKMSLEYLTATWPTQKAMKNSFYYLNKSRFLKEI